MDSKPFGNGSILEIFQENKKNWVWDFISQTLWNRNPPLSHYLLSILDFFSLEWRFHLKLEFNEDFYSIMVGIQIPEPNLFYFPGVLQEYCQCQKVLVHIFYHFRGIFSQNGKRYGLKPFGSGSILKILQENKKYCGL